MFSYERTTILSSLTLLLCHAYSPFAVNAQDACISAELINDANLDEYYTQFELCETDIGDWVTDDVDEISPETQEAFCASTVCQEVVNGIDWNNLPGCTFITDPTTGEDIIYRDLLVKEIETLTGPCPDGFLEESSGIVVDKEVKSNGVTLMNPTYAALFVIQLIAFLY